MLINRSGLALLTLVLFIATFIIFSSASSFAQSKIPKGSYKETCNNLRVLKGYLSGYCLNDKGDSVPARIYLDSCVGDIRNDNGELKCKQNPAYKPPSGTYKNSCRDIKLEGNKLKAECQKKNGNYKRTSINYKNCSRDIWNDNGELSCKKKNGVKLPKGSYKDTCRNAYTEGKRLYAECKKRGGGWNESSINYKNCDKDISNDNGKLVCGKSHSGKLPSGSYKNSCKNMYMEGGVLEADCKNDNGKWKHSSIKYKKCDKGIWNDNGKLRCNK